MLYLCFVLLFALQVGTAPTTWPPSEKNTAIWSVNHLHKIHKIPYCCRESLFIGSTSSYIHYNHNSIIDTIYLVINKNVTILIVLNSYQCKYKVLPSRIVSGGTESFLKSWEPFNLIWFILPSIILSPTHHTSSLLDRSLHWLHCTLNSEYRTVYHYRSSTSVLVPPCRRQWYSGVSGGSPTASVPNVQRYHLAVNINPKCSSHLNVALLASAHKCVTDCLLLASHDSANQHLIQPLN